MKKQIIKYTGITVLTGVLCLVLVTDKQQAAPKEAEKVEAGVTLALEDSDKYADSSSLEEILKKPEAMTKTEGEAKAVSTPAPEAKETSQEPAAKETPRKPAAVAGYTNLGVANVDSYLNVRTEASEGSKLAGKMPKNAGCEILETLDGWYRIQSGEVTGYVKSEFLLTGDAAVLKADEVLSNVATAKATNLNVRSEASTESSVIIKIGKGEKLEVIEQLDGWVKVAVDSDEGYVAAEYVTVAMELPTAVTLQDLYYGNGVSNTRVEMVEYAKQFLGNRYVWGGTSLTKGTDCSGFTMGIYRKFGVSLPHSSRAQAGYGTKVSLSEARPGDLVFYGSGRGINHVAMYIGNGQVIHASSKKTGIKISNVSYRSIKTIRRIIND